MQIIEFEGREIQCYGELRDDSNFEVICEDVEDDDVWTDGNPYHPEYTFASWKEVVEVMSKHFKDIVEITAV